MSNRATAANVRRSGTGSVVDGATVKWDEATNSFVDAGEPTGADGADGKTVRNGAGAPGAGLGVNGDFYIDTTADAIYGPKAGGAWGAATSLIGPAGTDAGAVYANFSVLAAAGALTFAPPAPLAALDFIESSVTVLVDDDSAGTVRQALPTDIDTATGEVTLANADVDDGDTVHVTWVGPLA